MSSAARSGATSVGVRVRDRVRVRVTVRIRVRVRVRVRIRRRRAGRPSSGCCLPWGRGPPGQGWGYG